mgnify:CR=1 FL=1
MLQDSPEPRCLCRTRRTRGRDRMKRSSRELPGAGGQALPEKSREARTSRVAHGQEPGENRRARRAPPLLAAVPDHSWDTRGARVCHLWSRTWLPVPVLLLPPACSLRLGGTRGARDHHIVSSTTLHPPPGATRVVLPRQLRSR